jgi:hypothetical protein
MTTRYVLLIDEAAHPERLLVTQSLKILKVSWWHHFQDSWLIKDPEGRPLEWWTSWIRDLLPDGSLLLLEVGPAAGGVAGRVPAQGTRWLRETWPKGTGGSTR